MTAFDWEKARARDRLKRGGGTPRRKGGGWARKPESMKGPSGAQQKELARLSRAAGVKYEHPPTRTIAQGRIQRLKRQLGSSARADKKIRRDRAKHRWNNQSQVRGNKT